MADLSTKAGKGFPLVVDGRAEAVIVVPESACPAVTLAAEELRHHVMKASGADLPVVAEDAVPDEPSHRVYLGATRAALSAGIDVSALSRDSYRISVRGHDLFLAGADGEGDPLNKFFLVSVGTLFAVYDVLDSDLGARWLWPGELGEHIPAARTLIVRARDTLVKPRFRFCKLRTDRREELIWMRRMRMHWDDGMEFGHAFGDWAERYGEEHPEWFEMDENGDRHTGLSMCVSNAKLHEQIVENWWAREKDRPAGSRSTINICENDYNGNCQCANCRAWDGPEAPQPRPRYYETWHNVSRRYARFAEAVLELARERDPNAEVTFYAYLNYVFGPDGVKLDPRIVAGFVADVFFPRTDEDHEWVKRQWLAWEQTGATLFTRPNYLLNGYCMPENWARQFADEFRFCQEHGMMGSEFDSLNGQWGTQGPILYTVGRLHAAPELSADEILEEYYSGFGPARAQAKAYWEYWETYTREHVDVLQDGTSHWTTYPKDAYVRFPLSSFEPAEDLLRQAEGAASEDPAASARVAFLRQGLEHARLCVETSLAIAEAGDDEDGPRRAVGELRRFRKSLEGSFAVNVDYRFYSCEARERNVGWPV